MTRARRAVPLLVVLGAVLPATGALLRWWTVQWQRPLLGPTATSVTGREAAPVLLVLAAASVAGWVATLAARSRWLRTALTVLLALLGVLVVVAVVQAVAAGPVGVVEAAHPEAEQVLAPRLEPLGPVLAAVGGVLVALAGALLLLTGGRGRGLSGRFDRAPADGSGAAATGARASAGRTGTGVGAVVPAAEDDEADLAARLWKELDAGADPTAGPGSAPAAADPAGPAADGSGGARSAARGPSAGRYHGHTDGPIGRDAATEHPPPQAGGQA